LDGLLVFLVLYADAIGVLALSAIGLLVIFGMMGVINMAHGELMMIGAFSTAYSYIYGLPIALAILVGGCAAMLVGVLLERIVVRHFYSRVLASLVATWGVSLILSQGTLILLGPTVQNLPNFFGSFAIGTLTFSYFRLFLFGMAVFMVSALWVLMKYTAFGLHARATMNNPDVARSLGVNTTFVYAITFGVGAFLAGVSGGLFALTAPVVPTFGQQYTAIAFIVVVVAGTRNLMAGFITAVLILAWVRVALTYEFNVLIGQLGMLIAAFIVILLAPSGIQDLLIRIRKYLRKRLAS
jgi:branched-subunit amino acid ABC-type transport system permease component